VVARSGARPHRDLLPDGVRAHRSCPRPRDAGGGIVQERLPTSASTARRTPSASSCADERGATNIHVEDRRCRDAESSARGDPASNIGLPSFRSARGDRCELNGRERAPPRAPGGVNLPAARPLSSSGVPELVCPEDARGVLLIDDHALFRCGLRELLQRADRGRSRAVGTARRCPLPARVSPLVLLPAMPADASPDAGPAPAGFGRAVVSLTPSTQRARTCRRALPQRCPGYLPQGHGPTSSSAPSTNVTPARPSSRPTWPACSPGRCRRTRRPAGPVPLPAS